MADELLRSKLSTVIGISLPIVAVVAVLQTSSHSLGPSGFPLSVPTPDVELTEAYGEIQGAFQQLNATPTGVGTIQTVSYVQEGHDTDVDVVVLTVRNRRHDEHPQQFEIEVNKADIYVVVPSLRRLMRISGTSKGALKQILTQGQAVGIALGGDRTIVIVAPRTKNS